MRYGKYARYTALAATVAVLQLQPASAQGAVNRAEFVKGVQCASLYGFIGGQVPSGSPAQAETSKRRAAWVDYAAKANGGDTGAAQQAAIETTIAMRRDLAALAGDEAKIAAKLQPLNTQCENPPPATVPAAKLAAAPRPAPAAKPAPTVTDRDRQNGERAIQCAGMARLNGDIENIIALDLYGDEATYQKIITHFRPDLPAKERESAIMAAMVEHGKLVLQDKEDSRANIMAGKGSLKPDQMKAVQRSQECARMVNALRSVKAID